MKPKPKSSASIFALTFMDYICCGLGALILLLIVNNGVSQGANEELAKVNEAEKNCGPFEEHNGGESRKTPPAWKRDVVCGIPGDSEYVIFIIDTSGSMRSIAGTVASKLLETLYVYPKIKGMQIMNADGIYLKPQSAGAWLPATGNGRIDILRSYVNWRDNSSSTPVGGLIEALGTYSKSNKEISIYIFGDDFTGDIDTLVQKVDEYNPVRSDGRKKIRIHGVGFPSAFGHDSRRGGGKFAKAMRALAERNGGAFVTVNGSERSEQRQFLTGLKMDGERSLILVDASLSMLDTSVRNVALYYRNATPAKKLQSAKWLRVLDSVDWLFATMDSEEYQIYLYNENVRSALPGSEGRWLKKKNGEQAQEVIRCFWNYPPEGGSNLEKALKSAMQLNPKPDNIYILTDGLPDLSDSFISGTNVSSRERLQHFRSAMMQIPIKSMPVNTIMFPFQGEPEAPFAYWKLARYTNGSFFVPAEDWPK